MGSYVLLTIPKIHLPPGATARLSKIPRLNQIKKPLSSDAYCALLKVKYKWKVGKSYFKAYNFMVFKNKISERKTIFRLKNELFGSI